MLDPLGILTHPEPLTREHIVCLPERHLVPALLRRGDGVLGTLCRQFGLAPVTILVREPEIIRTGQRGILEAFQALPLLEQDVEGLLETAQEIEGVDETEDQLQRVTVPRLDRQA